MTSFSFWDGFILIEVKKNTLFSKFCETENPVFFYFNYKYVPPQPNSHIVS